eukprot:NODE_686_length_5195_cov_0.321232.p4 type:complete len:196 gc:universal NODE_686_length_5195_cov_0.321232:4262-4849(+)
MDVLELDESLIDIDAATLNSPPPKSELTSQPNLIKQTSKLRTRSSSNHDLKTSHDTAIPRKSVKPIKLVPLTKGAPKVKSAIPTRQMHDNTSPQVVTPPNAHNPSGSPSLLSPNMPQAEIRDKMDKFIIEHRKYIRNFSDMYKKDMDVLAQLTLSLSSQRDTRSAFDEYLKNVDELAERKIQYANTLRQYIQSLK